MGISQGACIATLRNARSSLTRSLLLDMPPAQDGFLEELGALNNSGDDDLAQLLFGGQRQGVASPEHGPTPAACRSLKQATDSSSLLVGSEDVDLGWGLLEEGGLGGAHGAGPVPASLPQGRGDASVPKQGSETFCIQDIIQRTCSTRVIPRVSSQRPLAYSSRVPSSCDKWARTISPRHAPAGCHCPGSQC